ncbi:MAG: site-specific integrase, partial [Candidatus Methanofastidiosa archaeon]|nr:site-specific integrase [Candidatus Methanofastidiosa archaeon]
MDEQVNPRARAWFESYQATRDWITYKDLAFRTLNNYHEGMEKYCAFRSKDPDELRAEVIALQGSATVSNTVAKHIVDFQRHLLETGNSNGTPYAAGTILNYKTAAQSFYSHILGHKISVTPMVSRTERSRDKHIPTREEFRRMLDASDAMGRLYMLFQALTGVRIGDMLRMTIADVQGALQEETEYLLIPYSPQKRGKTIGKRHTVLPPPGVDALRAFLQYRQQKGEAFTSATPLFPSSKNPGKSISSSQINNIIREAERKAGILSPLDRERNVKLTSHELRAYFSNCMENAGMVKSHIDYMIGHKTDDYHKAYLQITPDTIIGDYKQFLWAV